MGRICKINGIDILRDIDVVMGHGIFNNSAYVYSTSVLTDPYIMRIEVDRSRENKSMVIFEFDGNQRVQVSTNYELYTDRIFIYPTHSMTLKPLKEVIAEAFNKFITKYVEEVADQLGVHEQW